MRLAVAAAGVLAVASPAVSQSIPDLSAALPVPGSWSYAPVAGGTEATFANASGTPQVWVQCARANRQVTISRAATAAAPFLNIWTSSASRSAPSSYNPATGRLTVGFINYDPLLDAIATSRGRIGFAIGTGPALVVPAWPEIARVIEDCRA